MTLTSGITTITLPNPQYGYTVLLRMALRARQIADGTIRHYDAGATYDARQLSLQWLLTADEQDDFEFLAAETRATRAATWTLALGATSTGFYPAGPDKGDVGTFTARILEWRSSARLEEPYQRVTVDATMLVETFPAYSLPDLVEQGDSTIGTVAGFLAPQYKAGYRPSWATEISQGGDPVSIDTGIASDAWTTEWDQSCNHSHAAALVNHLAAVARGEAFVVDAADELRPFGARGAGDTATARLSRGDIEIVHSEFDAFTVRMGVQLHAIA